MIKTASQAQNTKSTSASSGTGLISNEDVKKLQEMGFKTAIIYKAADIAQKENKNILDVVIQLSDSEDASTAASSGQAGSTNRSSSNSYSNNNGLSIQKNEFGDGSSSSSQAGAAAAGAVSTNGQNAGTKSQKVAGDYDVLTIDVRLRAAGIPVGLLNYGNTCYFNSLIQTYFFIPKFMETIMKYRSPNKLNMETLSQEKQRRITASINLVNNLQKLFGFMILSDKRYADPKAVLENIVDDQGNRVIMGDQKDIGEFNLQFLERVEEGLKYKEGVAYNFSNQQSSSSSSTVIDLLSGNDQPASRQLNKKPSFMATGADDNQQDSVINSLFFGKKKEFITYYSNGQFKHQSEENVFSPIILDLEYKDLYTSWENNSTFSVEDFKDESGKVTEAEKAGWITKSPEVLMFQIQRVVYVKEKGAAEKLNSPFHFEQEIYIDRFLLDNRSYIIRNKPKLKGLKKKRDMIMSELAKLKNYEKSKFSIVKIVDMAMQFLRTPEQLFEPYIYEEDKFSPKTQSMITGINYDEVTEFSLDQSNFKASQQERQQTAPSSSIDLLSLFDQPSAPVQQCPLTPNSSGMFSTIFGDENSTHAPNGTNKVMTPLDLNGKQNGSYGEISSQSNIQKREENTGKIDPRITEMNNQIEQFNVNKKNILTNSFVNAINTLKDQTQTLIESLEAELLKTNEEIESIYKNLKQVKYVLHAILIHQGYADSGHYFSFIRSQDQKKWFKFNDILVAEEDEESVMKQAVGDGKSSAYCLVYVKESRLKDNKYKHDFELMGDSVESRNQSNNKTTSATCTVEETANSTVIVKKKHVVIDLLNLESDSNNNSANKNDSPSASSGSVAIEQVPIRSLVKDDLQMEILSQNRQQQVELAQFKQIQLADSIVENYSRRFAFINEYIRKTYDKTKKLQNIPPMTNFGVYLRWLNDNVTDIQKVQLLDCSIREISQQKMMLSDLPKHQILHNRLVNNFEGVGEFKSPGKIVLTARDYEIINQEYTKYLAKVSCSFAILEAFDLILKNEIIASFGYMHYIQKYSVFNDYFYRMCRDMFKVLLLKASCSLFDMANEPNEVILRHIKYILLYSYKLQEGDITLSQISRILNDYMRHIGNVKLALQREKITLFISSLNDNGKLQDQFMQFITSQEKQFEQMETVLMEKAMNSDKYFWKVEDVSMEMETAINQKFQKISAYLREHITFHQNIAKHKIVLDMSERISHNYQVRVPK